MTEIKRQKENKRKEDLVMKKKIIACFLMLAMMVALVPAGIVQAATYKTGTSGIKVQYLQQNLTFLGFSTKGADGNFGNNTKQAVLEVQKKLGVSQTGLVDDALYQRITNTVSDIQKYLKYKGYYNGLVDGIAGAETQKSLADFQQEVDIKPTGVVDKDTYWVLKAIVNDSKSMVPMPDLRDWYSDLDKLEWQDYLALFGEEYLQLFTTYPYCLVNETFEKGIATKMNVADEVLSKNEDSTFLGAFLTGLKDGIGIIWDETVSLFTDHTKSYKEKMRLNAIQYVLEDTCNDKNLIAIVAEEIGEEIEKLESGYSMDTSEGINSLGRDIAATTNRLSYDSIKDILECISEDEALKETLNSMDMAIDIVDYAVSAIQLYQIDIEIVDRLLSILPSDCDMYQDLLLLKKERNRDELEYFKTRIGSSVIQGAIVGCLSDAMLPFPSNVVMVATKIGVEVYANYFYKGALSEDLIQTLLLKTYATTLKCQLMEMQLQYLKGIQQENATDVIEEIEDYEFVFSIYLSAVKSYLESMKKMADKSVASQIDQCIKEIDELYTYENYIRLCIKAQEQYREETKSKLQAKMDFMLEQQLGDRSGKTVYFTVSRTGCKTRWEGNHRCPTHCNMRDIAKARWFIDVFGNVNVDNFPEHDYTAIIRDHTGQSCFGFACFAQWYLYADYANEKIIGERVALIEFNKQNVEKYVKPGDVIRVNNHSVLVYSLEENGIKVIDSNWDTGGQKNCAVQKHDISYTGKYAGKIAYINRVTKNSDVAGKYYGKATSKMDETMPTITPEATAIPKPTATPVLTPVLAVSGWVKASDCPVGATIVDTKWTYTFIDRTESTSATKDGWIRDGERKEVVANGTFDYATFPENFDTSHAVYNSMYTSKNANPVADGATREILSDSPAGYVYWHYAYPVSGGGNAGNRIVGYYYNQNLKYVGNWCYATEFCAFKSTKNYTTTANNKEGGGTVYKVTDSDYVKYDVAKGSHWWYRFEYNTCTYQDVKTLYQYYKSTEKESKTEVYEGNGKSNVVKWVRYK